jgi:glycosyltransferase involved in cell wall biosynthesis
MITLHADLGRQWRGGQSQALLLMKGLRDRGHRAELVCLQGSPLERRAEAEGICVHAVRPQFARAHAALKISKALERIKPDIVHTHEAHALTAAWLARANRHAGVAASRRLAYPLGPNRVSLARYRRVSRVLAVSRFVAESVVQSGIARENVIVVYDGVEIPLAVSADEHARAREHWGVGEAQRLLGCVGYLLPEKGQELLIRAWPAVQQQAPSCRLLLAGEGPSRPKLEGLSRELGVAESVRFAGLVENVREVYAALDFFLFPSLAEPLGSSMLAAMSHGLATVAQARGAVPEVITHAENGLLVEGPNPDQFGSAILRLLRKPERARRLGAAARRTIEEKFSAASMVEETLRVYEEIIEERAKA